MWNVDRMACADYQSRTPDPRLGWPHTYSRRVTSVIVSLRPASQTVFCHILVVPLGIVPSCGRQIWYCSTSCRVTSGIVSRLGCCFRYRAKCPASPLVLCHVAGLASGIVSRLGRRFRSGSMSRASLTISGRRRFGFGFYLRFLTQR